MLITDNLERVIRACFVKYDYMGNGYIRDVLSNVSYNPDMWDCHAEITGLPEGIVCGGYCYTPERGFYEYLTKEQRIKDEAITEVQKGVANGEM